MLRVVSRNNGIGHADRAAAAAATDDDDDDDDDDEDTICALLLLMMIGKSVMYVCRCMSHFS